MRVFFEEYGTAFFIMICITILVMIASPISTNIAASTKETVTKLADIVNNDDSGIMNNANSTLAKAANNNLNSGNVVNDDALSKYGTNEVVTNEGELTSGDVDVIGFYIDSGKSAGSAAEYMPNVTAVSRSSNKLTVNGEEHEVSQTGTIYGYKSKVSANDMTLDSANQYVYSCTTTSKGVYEGYSEGKEYKYYGFTWKYVQYNFSSLTVPVSYRAYAILDDGRVVYGKNVRSTDIYNVAKDLYESSKMSNEQGHKFLYDNVLNVVTMDTNRSKISNSMAKAMGVTSTSSNDYKLINAAYKDIGYYTKCTNGYNYKDREEFSCKPSTSHTSDVITILSNLGYEVTGANAGEVLERVLLEKLNDKAGTNEPSLSDWIYKHTPSYHNSQGVYYEGFYRKVEYDASAYPGDNNLIEVLPKGSGQNAE